MYICRIVFALFYIVFGLYGNQCLKAVLERTETVYVNESYVQDFAINVRRASRRGDYGVNINFTSNDFWGNNYTMSAKFFEYLNNQYKPSFIQFDHRLCNFFTDNFFAVVLTNRGFNICPIPAGRHILKNLVFDMELPSLWPFNKGMIQAAVYHESDLVGKVNIMFTMINNIPVKHKISKV